MEGKKKVEEGNEMQRSRAQRSLRGVRGRAPDSEPSPESAQPRDQNPLWEAAVARGERTQSGHREAECLRLRDRESLTNSTR